MSEATEDDPEFQAAMVLTRLSGHPSRACSASLGRA